MADGDESIENIKEIQERLDAFDSALNNVEDTFKPVLETPYNDVISNISTLERAKFDLVGCFAMTSLFWMYLNLNGIDVKEHPIRQELDRIKKYMSRSREIQEKQKADAASGPKLNIGATKRFVRNALWSAAHGSASANTSLSEKSNTNSKRSKGSKGTNADQSRKKRPKTE